MEIIILILLILFIWFQTKDEVRKERRRAKPSKPKQKSDYSTPDGWYTYSPELVQFNKFKAMKIDYLNSQTWKAKRELVLARDGYKCVCCDSTASLNIHHIRYDKVPNEPISDLVSLCRSCHIQLHEDLGYPQTYETYMKMTFDPKCR